MALGTKLEHIQLYQLRTCMDRDYTITVARNEFTTRCLPHAVINMHNYSQIVLGIILFVTETLKSKGHLTSTFGMMPPFIKLCKAI